MGSGCILENDLVRVVVIMFMFMLVVLSSVGIKLICEVGVEIVCGWVVFLLMWVMMNGILVVLL